MWRFWERRHAPWFMLWPMALAQVVSWGTLYYSFSLFAGPMHESLGWPLPALNGALTLGLLVTGLMAYPVGALLDRHGGRWLMTAGSATAGALLLAWSRIGSLPIFYVLWAGLGVCMACVLIEAAFAVINQHFGAEARRGIVAMTLVTGLAGTVFVPLIGFLLAHLDWRETLVVLALLHFAWCVPVHFCVLPPRKRPAQGHAHTDAAAGRALMRLRLRTRVFWGLALWYTSYTLTASGLIFQLVPILRAESVPDERIFWCFALIGPVQVAARFLMVTAARGATTRLLGACTTALTPLAVVLLACAPPTTGWLSLFACCFGVGHGVTTILRGVAPAEWLGREHYGRMMGALALPMMFAMALAPLLTALVWEHFHDPIVVWWTIFAGSLFGAVGFWLAALAPRPAFLAPPEGSGARR